MTTTNALAKKIRLVSEDSRLIGSARHPEIDFDGLALAERDLLVVGMPELAPDDERVRSRRYAGNRVPAIVVRHSEERVAEHEDVGAHVRMDVARDGHDAGRIELVAPGAARRVAPEIEAVAAPHEREDIVKRCVVVRELHEGPGR